jgi:soluble cytochrome b562
LAHRGAKLRELMERDVTPVRANIGRDELKIAQLTIEALRTQVAELVRAATNATWSFEAQLEKLKALAAETSSYALRDHGSFEDAHSALDVAVTIDEIDRIVQQANLDVEQWSRAVQLIENARAVFHQKRWMSAGYMDENQVRRRLDGIHEELAILRRERWLWLLFLQFKDMDALRAEREELLRLLKPPDQELELPKAGIEEAARHEFDLVKQNLLQELVQETVRESSAVVDDLLHFREGLKAPAPLKISKKDTRELASWVARQAKQDLIVRAARRAEDALREMQRVLGERETLERLIEQVAAIQTRARPMPSDVAPILKQLTLDAWRALDTNAELAEVLVPEVKKELEVVLCQGALLELLERDITKPRKARLEKFVCELKPAGLIPYVLLYQAALDEEKAQRVDQIEDELKATAEEGEQSKDEGSDDFGDSAQKSFIGRFTDQLAEYTDQDVTPFTKLTVQNLLNRLKRKNEPFDIMAILSAPDDDFDDPYGETVEQKLERDIVTLFDEGFSSDDAQVAAVLQPLLKRQASKILHEVETRVGRR